MPFKSESQRKYLYANEPELAQEFEDETPEGADLPEYKPMNRGGIAGDWRDEMAGYMDEKYGGTVDEPQHLFDGGTAGSNFDVDMGGSNTVRGISPLAPLALPPSAPPPPTFNPRAGLPPAPVAPVLPSVPVASAVAPTLPAPSGPDPLQSYLAEQKQRLNRYGPDEQMALEQSLDKQRRGLGPNLALAGTGLADAIMQGVARAGSSGFQSNLQNRMDKTQEGQRQAFESGRAGHLGRMKQEMELAQIDPESPLSRMTQRANRPLLKSMGLHDDEITQIPASLMGEIQTRRLTLEEIREKAESNRLMAEQNAIALGLKKQTAEEASKTAAQEGKIKGLEGRAKLGFFGGLKNPELAAAYEQQGGLGKPTTTQVNSREEWEALPPGTPYTDSNGKYGVKK